MTPLFQASLAKPGDWGGLCTLRNLRLQAVSRC